MRARQRVCNRPARRSAAVLATLPWLLPAVPAQAEPFSRGGAVARALLQNPQVAASRAAEAQAEARRNQARAARYPTVSVTLGTGPSLKADLVPGTAVESTENTYGDVGLSDISIAVGGQLEILQPIYTFGKIGDRERAAEHEMRARRAQTDMTRADVATNVAQLYEGLLFARDAARFFDETDHWLARTIEDTEAELGAGTGVTEQDLLRMQAAAGVVRMGLHQARAARRQAAAGLAAYLNLASGATVEPKEPALEMLPTPPPDPAPLIELALSHRPELRAAAEASAAYEALADAEAAGYLPDLFAMGFVFGGYTPGRDPITTRYVQDPLNGFYPGLLVGARWQITGPMAGRREDENRALAREYAHTREWALAGLPADVTRAFEDVQRAKRDASESDKSVIAAKRWMVQASADYSVGLGSSRDITDAAEAYLQLRIAYFDAKYRHNAALADLARATGTLITPPSPYYPIQEEQEQP